MEGNPPAAAPPAAGAAAAATRAAVAAAAAADPPATTFWGRFVDMLHVCGPQSWPTLLATPADLAAAAATVAAASQPGGGGVADDDLRAARRLRAAVLHPDTGEPIPLPFRMAAHVPANTVLLLGMCFTASPLGTAGWQWANSTFNLAQFYANRNRSNDVPDAHVAASYVGAMTSSVAVGYALRRAAIARQAAVAALPAPSAAAVRGAYLAAAAVPFAAAVAGKPLQIGLMRWDELTRGVTVYDADGAPRGASVRAGEAAVGMTVLSRVVYLAPMLWLPLLQDAACAAVPALGASRAGRAATAVTLTALSSAYVTPACMAIFDQRASLPARALEPPLHGLALASTGGPVERLYFNKGL